MTRKHFIAIAKAIRTCIKSVEDRESIARELLPALKASNPSFDSQRFLNACLGQ